MLYIYTSKPNELLHNSTEDTNIFFRERQADGFNGCKALQCADFKYKLNEQRY